MNVQVRILTMEARAQIRQLEAELRRFKRSVNSGGIERAAAGTDRLSAATSRYAASTNAAVAGNNRMTSSFGRAMTAGTKFGNQLQWTGRQLQYNFAMPIALGAAWATSAAFKHEAAMTRIQKVYGDGSQSAETYNAELKAMERLITALSNKFGVAREEVGAIAADWAAAGAEAGALARAVNLTMEMMVLGEVDAATATKSLIAIQAQYGADTKQLTKIIADLNMVENETGTTMNDLVQAMSRAAAVARTASVDHRHLAAMTAALVPSAGSATQAGNGLKTMITRLMSPTNQAADAMEQMGVKVYDASWNTMTASERLEHMAERYKGLTANQKIFVSDLVAGKWQIAKWSQLMADVGSDAGYYQKALNATKDPAKVTKQYMEELNRVLESNPQKFKQAGTIIRNSFADVMIKLLPYIVFVAQKMAQLAQAFSDLNPYAQMAIMGVLGFLLVFGPLLRYMGSSLTLFATFGDALKWIGTKFLGLGGAAAAGAATTEAAQVQTTRAVARGGAAQQGILAKTMKGMVAGTALGWRGIWGATAAGVRATTGVEMSRANASNALQARWAARQTAMQGKHAGTQTSILAGMWQSLLGIQTRGQHAATAHAARHAATSGGQHARQGGMIAGIWASTWQKILMTQVRGQHVSSAHTARHAATSGAQHAAHGRSLAGIWAGTWALITRQESAHHAASHARTAGAESRRAAIIAAAQARIKGVQQAGLAGMIMAEHGFHTKRKAAWAATQNFVAGGELGWAGRMRAAQGSFIASAIMAEHGFHTKRKAAWAATQNFIAGGEAGWAARMKGISSGFWGATLAQDTGAHAKRNAGWQRFFGVVTATATAGHARLKTITSGAMAATVAEEQGAHIKRNAGWQRFFGVVSAGHTAFWARMRGTQAAGHAGMAATETAALTASKGRWGAHMASLTAMGNGGGAAAAGKGMGSKFVNGLKGPFRILPKLLKGPWILALAGIVALVIHFREDIARILRNVADWGMQTFAIWVPFFQKLNNKIVEAFYRLPKGVRDAMIAVVNVVKSAAQAVYKLFSYLNPFARHSPSLVEQVEKGMAKIKQEYAGVGNVGAVFAKAAADLKKFKDAAAALGRDEWADQRADVAKAFPSMLPAFNQLVGHLKSLNTLSAQQKAAVQGQQAVVDKWETALDGANAALDAQQDKLDVLKDKLSALEDQYSSHKDAMQAYASAPIKGMGAMEDQIFANEQAQKKLRLEMLRWEQANGSIEEVRNTLAMLQGDIEMARGEAAGLRAAGAGSDILGPIEAEIAAMEAQYKATEQAMRDSPVSKMQEELERLGREAEILELEKSLSFDSLIREIDKLVNAQEELSYEEIVAGINKEKAAMAALEPQIAAATAAVAAQEQAVKNAQAARDAISNTYDQEKAKLESLEEEYRKTEELIRDIESALNDLGSASAKAISDAEKAAKEANDSMSTADKFAALGEADLPDVGGQAGIGREGDVGDIEALTEQLARDTAKMFGSLDMLEPFKKAWGKVKEWWATQAWPVLEPYIGPIRDRISAAWGKLFDGKGFDLSDVTKKLEEGGIWAYEKAVWIKDKIMAVWRLIGPDIKDAFRNAWESVKKGAGDIWNEIKGLGDLWEPLKVAAGHLWGVLKTVFIIGMGLVLASWKVIWSVIAEVVGPVIDFISDLIENLIQIFKGVIQVILAIINGDWKLALEGMKNIVVGILDGIWDIFKNFGAIIWGVVKGIVEGIFGFFQWLWNELVGNSIVPDIVNGIVEWFGKLISAVATIFEAVWNGMKWAWDNIAVPIFDAIWTAIQAFGTVIGWVWENVMKPAWDAIWWGIQAVWDNIAKPIFTAIWDGIKLWAAVFTWVWDNILKPAFGAIWTGVQWTWDNVAKPIFNAIWEGIKTWAAIFGWVWDNLIKPAAEKIWAGIKWGWDNVLKPVFGFIWDALKWVGDKFAWLWDKAIKPAWDAVKTAIKWAWDNVLKPIFGYLKDTVQNAGDKFSWLWNNAIKPAWDAIKGAIQWAWDNVLGPALRGLRDIAGSIGSAFSTLQGTMSTVWGGIKSAVSGPINTIKGWIEDLMNLARDAKNLVSNIGGGISSGFSGLTGGIFSGDWKLWASGGKMDTSVGAGFTTNRPKAIVGEGNPLYPEYVIPTDPRYRKNATALWGDLGTTLGYLKRNGADAVPVPMLAAGGVLGSVGARLAAAQNRQAVTITSGGNNVTEIHFHGDLSFPNVKNGEDADDFIRNLETLVG
jgi:TP901 family phage tail tape measure protein